MKVFYTYILSLKYWILPSFMVTGLSIPIMANESIPQPEYDVESVLFQQSNLNPNPQFSENQKLKFLQVYSTFILGELKANQLDIEHAISCFEQGNDTKDESCKEVFIKAPNYIAAFQDMRLHLSLARPQRWSNQDNPKLLEGTKLEQYLKDKITLDLKHLFGNFEISYLMSVPLKEELQPMSADEIQQALVFWEIDSMAADQELKEWYESHSEQFERQADESDREYNFRNDEESKLKRKWKWRHNYRKKAYQEHRQQYLEQIKKYPLVIFMTAPEKPKQQWKEANTPEFFMQPMAWYPHLASALKQALQLNTDLIDMVSKARKVNDFNSLLALVGFKKSLSNYLTILENSEEIKNTKSKNSLDNLTNNEQEQLVAQLVNEFDDVEFHQDMKYIGALVLAGALCVAGPGKIAKIPGAQWAVSKLIKSTLSKNIAKGIGIFTCTVGTGIVANTLFYDITLGRYQQTYRQVFAAPGSHIVFAEFSDYHGRDVELLFESTFYFLGTGVAEFSKKVSPAVINFLKNAIH
ncbi:MAG: hypothetical protein H6625_01290 [Bdellovibrionaceae bacterium]|nr:hypothetical protein [Pseudobdellovibrionaceae bacterium]